jgi:hypothetical protein
LIKRKTSFKFRAQAIFNAAKNTPPSAQENIRAEQVREAKSLILS